MIFGNIYEIKFDETGPIPSCIPETAPSILVSGVSIPDALARWENSRCTGYVPYLPLFLLPKFLRGSTSSETQHSSKKTFY